MSITVWCDHKTQRGEGSCTDADQSCRSGCGLLYQACPRSVRLMCCATWFATNLSRRIRVWRKMSSCYFAWRNMISTSSYGTCISRPWSRTFHSTTTAMCTMCCAGKGHSACVDEVHGLGAGTAELRVWVSGVLCSTSRHLTKWKANTRSNSGNKSRTDLAS